MVIHEIFGLTDWEPTVVDRLAKQGYVAIVPDLLSSKYGRSPADPDSAGSSWAISSPSASPPTSTRPMPTSTRCRRCGRATSGTIGFCWGGGESFRYATNNPKLRAAVVCYGPPPDTAAMKRITAPVLGIYGENDERIARTLPEVTAAMQTAGKTYTTEVYPGTGHGFLHPGREGSDGPQAERAWKRILEFTGLGSASRPEGGARGPRAISPPCSPPSCCCRSPRRPRRRRTTHDALSYDITLVTSRHRRPHAGRGADDVAAPLERRGDRDARLLPPGGPGPGGREAQHPARPHDVRALRARGGRASREGGGRHPEHPGPLPWILPGRRRAGPTRAGHAARPAAEPRRPARLWLPVPDGSGRSGHGPVERAGAQRRASVLASGELVGIDTLTTDTRPGTTTRDTRCRSNGWPWRRAAYVTVLRARRRCGDARRWRSGLRPRSAVAARAFRRAGDIAAYFTRLLGPFPYLRLVHAEAAIPDPAVSSAEIALYGQDAFATAGPAETTSPGRRRGSGWGTRSRAIRRRPVGCSRGCRPISRPCGTPTPVVRRWPRRCTRSWTRHSGRIAWRGAAPGPCTSSGAWWATAPSRPGSAPWCGRQGPHRRPGRGRPDHVTGGRPGSRLGPAAGREGGSPCWRGRPSAGVDSIGSISGRSATGRSAAGSSPAGGRQTGAGRCHRSATAVPLKGVQRAPGRVELDPAGTWLVRLQRAE